MPKIFRDSGSSSAPLIQFLSRLLTDFIPSSQRDNAAAQFLSSAPTDYQFVTPSEFPLDYSAATSQTLRVETTRRQLAEQHESVLYRVIELEVRLGIAHRWQPTTPEYVETTKYMATRNYHRALDNLQRLVILRLFELQKLNLAKTGK